ncbi:hypothetical protein ABZY10_39765 [Streptomyces sp. NPDC006539]|uniref:hypothetical protein n=1 Tax=Streptomyces TaxID=1883 RepID=UPI003394DEC5
MGSERPTIGRIWKKFDLKPHLQDSFKLFADPPFVDGVVRHSASPYSVVLPPGPGAASDRPA